MKILMILGTGAILSFPMAKSVNLDCFSQGHHITQKIATYQGPGPEQGWYLKGTKIHLAGFYCK